MVTLSILIPAYNEIKTIDQILRLVNEADTKDVKKEIIIVDDSSTDGTTEYLKKLTGVKTFFHKKNQGKGAAIKTALKHATGDIIIIQDADLEYDPKDYMKVIQPIIEGKEKIVYGSRRLNKENTQYSGLSFFIGGNLVTLATNILYAKRLTDEPTCYKAFEASTLKNMNLQCERFEFCPEVTAKAFRKGINIKEVPINYYPRTTTEGKKIKWFDGVEAITTLLRYRFGKID